MQIPENGSRALFIAGVVALLAGAIDPLEGSVIIAVGSVLMAIFSAIRHDHLWGGVGVVCFLTRRIRSKKSLVVVGTDRSISIGLAAYHCPFALAPV